MNSQPGVDAELADWLEDGPTKAPRQVLETVAAALPSIPQRRAGLRLPSLSQFLTPPVRIATLFAAVSPPGSVFERVLQKFFGGKRDDRTLHLLGGG